jgi:hypothetical protein
MHGDCFATMAHCGLVPDDCRDAEQGFVTDKGSFVDRVEALAIAERFAQIVEKHRPFDILLSEDLFKKESTQ